MSQSGRTILVLHAALKDAIDGMEDMIGYVPEYFREKRLSAPLAELLADRIPKAAAKAHRRYPMVPAEDFEQAMWERVLVNPAKFGRLFDDGRYGIIWAELCREATRVGRADDRWRRWTKARQAGYETHDEEFYGKRSLEALLPILVDADFDVPAIVEQATNGTDKAGVHIVNPDPAAAEGYIASLVDVAAAYKRLPLGMQRLLKSYYGINQEDSEDGRWDRQKLASSMGLTYEALTGRVYRAVTRLQDGLGGESPWPRR